MAAHYHHQNIRTLLLMGFTEEELLHICYDVPGFRSVKHSLNDNSSKVDIVNKLVERAESTLQMKELLNWTRTRNPARYEEHKPYFYNELIPSVSRHKNIFIISIIISFTIITFFLILTWMIWLLKPIPPIFTPTSTPSPTSTLTPTLTSTPALFEYIGYVLDTETLKPIVDAKGGLPQKLDCFEL